MTEPATEDTKTCDSASTAEKQETKDPSDDNEEQTNHPGMSTDIHFSLKKACEEINEKYPFRNLFILNFFDYITCAI